VKQKGWVARRQLDAAFKFRFMFQWR
jgi:hypothetical protein